MRAVVVAAMVLVSACAGEAAVETTTTTVQVEPPSTTPTMVVDPTTTTTVAAEPVDICSRGVVWESGQAYAADCFFVSVLVEPEDEGWRSAGAGDNWLLITYADSGVPLAEIALLGYEPEVDFDVVAESIRAIEGLTVLSGPLEITVGGFPGVSFEVESAPDPSKEPIWPECESLSLGTKIGPSASPGWRLIDGGRFDYGFAPCRVFRVWVVDAAGLTVTVLAVAEDEFALSELMPLVERLLDSMTFEAP